MLVKEHPAVGDPGMHPGDYGVIIRLIPMKEISRTKGFPCGLWFEVLINSTVRQLRHDHVAKIEVSSESY